MAALSLSIPAIRPLNRWDYASVSLFNFFLSCQNWLFCCTVTIRRLSTRLFDAIQIRPGPVGSVGDVNMQVRFKHSTPNMPLRFDPNNAHGAEPFHGSNVSDGFHTSFYDDGGPAHTIDSNWGGRRDFKTSHGWIYQDVRCPDKRVEPIVGSTPQYSWHNKIATTYNARRTGELFLPLPGEYRLAPGEIPRGGSQVRPTDEVGGDAPEEPDCGAGFCGLPSGTGVVGTNNKGPGYTRIPISRETQYRRLR
jgi:hypothetical protein